MGCVQSSPAAGEERLEGAGQQQVGSGTSGNCQPATPAGKEKPVSKRNVDSPRVGDSAGSLTLLGGAGDRESRSSSAGASSNPAAAGRGITSAPGAPKGAERVAGSIDGGVRQIYFGRAPRRVYSGPHLALSGSISVRRPEQTGITTSSDNGSSYDCRTGADSAGPLSLDEPHLESILGRKNEAAFEDIYTLGAVVGRGAFANTHICTDSDRVLACKLVEKKTLTSKEMVSGARREVQIMRRVAGHKHVVGLVDTVESADSLYLVMELCSGGDLLHTIARMGHYSERKAAAIFKDTLSGVKHLHSMGVVHRDLKPENLLFVTEGDTTTLKVADFALARFFLDGERLTEAVGSITYAYAAPEVLKRSYGPECDMWSLGVILYVMLSGGTPFCGRNDTDTIQRIMAGKVDTQSAPWPSISAEAKDLVRKLLTLDSAARLTPAQALEHPWISAAPDAPIGGEVLARMRQFSCQQRFRKLGLMALVQHLDAEEVEDLLKIFSELDADGSGQLTPAALRDGLERRGVRLSAEEVQELAKPLDVDGRGKVDYREFLAATVPLAHVATEDIRLEAFADMDSRDLGFIDADSVAAFMVRLGMDFDRTEVESMIAPADTTRDGKVSFDEWCAMLAAAPGGGGNGTGNGALGAAWEESLLAKWEVASAHGGSGVPPEPPSTLEAKIPVARRQSEPQNALMIEVLRAMGGRRPTRSEDRGYRELPPKNKEQGAAAATGGSAAVDQALPLLPPGSPTRHGAAA